MAKNFQTVRSATRYMFNDELQALVEVTILREVFNLNNGKCYQEWRVANTDKVMKTCYSPATEDETEKFDGKMYRTFKDFEKGKVMSIEDVFWKRGEGDVCGGLVKYNLYIRIDEKGAFFWTFMNGEAVKWYFIDHIDRVKWEYVNGGGSACEVTADEDVEIPQCYSSPEDVWKYNDYRFIDEKGEETVREGVYKRLMLEPDQVELADKLQAVLDECKAAGMKVYFNLCGYDLNAVNVRHIERIEYGPSIDEDTEAAYPFEDYRAGRAFSGVYDLNTEDDDIKFVIKKQ